MTFDPMQIRVLGSLIEKEIATPENYPLSLNALVNACNQRSSRDPVLNLTEEEVRRALRTLEDEDLVAVEHSSRVEKYEHRIRTVLDLRRDETALLCLLFLRGPQTPGELRARTDRLYSFDGLDAVESTLARMTAAPDPASGLAFGPGTVPGKQTNIRPLAVMLPRQPGSRESRYAHLLGGPVASIGPGQSGVRDSYSSSIHPRDSCAIEPASHTATESASVARILALEAEVASLRAAVAQLQESLAQLESGLNPESPK